jgi:hypothetical protein
MTTAMKPFATIAIVAGFLSVVMTGILRADILLSEKFDYPDGVLTTASNNLWIDNSGTTVNTYLNVASGAAILTSANAQDDARSFAPMSAGVIYYGFDARVTSVPGTSGSYIMALWDGESGMATDYIARLQVAQGFSSSKVKFGILNNKGNPVVFYGSEFDLQTTVRIVVAFNFATMTSTLWINPTDASNTSVTDTTAASFTDPTNTLGYILMRQTTAIGTTVVDNLIVATTFADVAAVPEPGTVAMVTLGLSVVGWRMRRHRVRA